MAKPSKEQAVQDPVVEQLESIEKLLVQILEAINTQNTRSPIRNLFDAARAEKLTLPYSLANDDPTAVLTSFPHAEGTMLRGLPSITPTQPVKWVWRRLAKALGMNVDKMYFDKPLRGVNKSALVNQLNKRFKKQGIKFRIGDLKPTKNVGDVYDVIMGKL